MKNFTLTTEQKEMAASYMLNGWLERLNFERVGDVASNMEDGENLADFLFSEKGATFGNKVVAKLKKSKLDLLSRDWFSKDFNKTLKGEIQDSLTQMVYSYSSGFNRGTASAVIKEEIALLQSDKKFQSAFETFKKEDQMVQEKRIMEEIRKFEKLGYTVTKNTKTE